MSALNKNQASIGALLMSAKCQQQTFSLSLDIIDSVPETVRKLAGRHHETSPPEILAPGGGCRFTIRNIKYRGRSNVGFTAGSPTDILARLIGQWLSERLGQPFVVEDRPGAATNIATEEVAHAPPDGYTLLAAVSTNTINPARDIAMVAGLTRSAEVLEVNPALPVTSVSELIAYVRTNPGKLSLGSFGTGTISHVAGVIARAISRLRAIGGRSARRASASRLRQRPVIHRIHQGWQTACARRHKCNALTVAAGRSSARQLPARI